MLLLTSFVFLSIWFRSFVADGQPMVITDGGPGPYVQDAWYARSYQNLISFWTGASCTLCLFYNNVPRNCIVISAPVRDSVFYQPDKGAVYLITTTANFVDIYKTQANETFLNVTLFWTSNEGTYPPVYSADVDYNHRWMALGGTNQLLLFDISDMNNIVKTDNTSVPVVHSVKNFLKRNLSIRRNLVCQASTGGTGGGFFCCPIEKGKFTGACKTYDNAWTSTIQVYDDYVVACSSGIRLFDPYTRQLIGAANTGACMDFVRSKNLIIYANWADSKLAVIDISNPKNPFNLTILSIGCKPWSLYSNEYDFYYTCASLRRLNFTTGFSYDEFYRNSDSFQIGATINPLKSDFTSFRYEFDSIPWLPLSASVRDTWYPDGVNITYIVNLLPVDYVLERWQNGNWMRHLQDSNFSQADVNASNVRIRVNLQANPTSRNLTQFLRLTATNGRVSFVSLDIDIAQLFSAVNCPSLAICDGSSKFICQAGATPDVNGINCLQCSSGFKKDPGNYPCVPCPLGASCSSVEFTCPVGTIYTSASNDCLACQTGYYRPPALATGCVKCPSNAVCNQTDFQCQPSFLRSQNLECNSCPQNGMCDGSSTLMCVDGYHVVAGSCVQDQNKSSTSSIQLFLIMNQTMVLSIILPMLLLILLLIGFISGMLWGATKNRITQYTSSMTRRSSVVSRHSATQVIRNDQNHGNRSRTRHDVLPNSKQPRRRSSHQPQVRKSRRDERS